ncbi:MAG TPA: histone deacetylase family protein [Gammaproteobacteria bacterium]|nr:histone deacetylase family protein [Gammaproteobacteria bacterium]
MTTGFITHPACRQHDMGEFHPECPARLAAIEDQLLAAGLDGLLTHLEAPLVTREQLERVHLPAYVDEIEQLAPRQGHVELDPDTSMNPHSLEAARRAAGALILATDSVIGGDLDNAFCSVRPPGHHAERGSAMGFCLFNNLACGAAHALASHGLERVVILDFDVHHGNGTEHIFADDDRVLVCSSFQYPFYPFTDLSRTPSNVVTVPLHRGAGGWEFRDAVTSLWLPAVERFRPQMVFVSAGFDAHREDPLAELNLGERDYTWVSHQVMEIARRFADGRLVSTLEGGYNLSALGRSVVAHLRVLLGIDPG